MIKENIKLKIEQIIQVINPIAGLMAVLILIVIGACGE